jgi:hypothetical protein
MNKLIIHHTAVPGTSNQLMAVNRYHKEKWNMKSELGWYVGYTHFIDKDGTLTQTRTPFEESAHTIGHNGGGNIAVCIAGDFRVEKMNAEQVSMLRKFINLVGPHHETFFHNELQDNRSCPGFDREWFNKTFLTMDDKETKIKDMQKTLDSIREVLLKMYLYLKNINR